LAKNYLVSKLVPHTNPIMADEIMTRKFEFIGSDHAVIDIEADCAKYLVKVKGIGFVTHVSHVLGVTHHNSIMQINESTTPVHAFAEQR
jgi:hypothetical protein